MSYLIAFCFSFLLTTVLVPVFIKIGNRMSILDMPDARKVHGAPIPRTGGIALLIGSLLPFVLLTKDSRLIISICLGGICILIIGIIDDIKDLDYRWKFLGQILASLSIVFIGNMKLNASIEIWRGVTLNLKVFSVPLTIFFLLATMNIINLADGLDGLAGGICLLIFSCSAFFAFFSGSFPVVALCVCVIGAIIGFLRYNTFPAIVFLGDTGSLFLGFTVGVSMLLLTRDRAFYSPAISLFIIGVPIIDTSAVILERLMDRRPIFKPDRNHIHHKIMGMGFKHNEVVVIIYAIQLLMILLAWFLRFMKGGILLGIYALLWGFALTLFLLIKKCPVSAPDVAKKAGPLAVPKGMHAYNTILSSGSANSIAWYGLAVGMVFFCFFSPFIVQPVSWDIGSISLVLLIGILLAERFAGRIQRSVLKLSAYFVTLFFIYSIEYRAGRFLLIYNILLAWMVLCYIVYLISSKENIPLFNMDYLLLALVFFVLFIPKTSPVFIYLRNIGVKTLFMSFFIEIFFYKLKGDKSLLMRWTILYALCLTSVIALLFVIQRGLSFL